MCRHPNNSAFYLFADSLVWIRKTFIQHPSLKLTIRTYLAIASHAISVNNYWALEQKTAIFYTSKRHGWPKDINAVVLLTLAIPPTEPAEVLMVISGSSSFSLMASCTRLYCVSKQRRLLSSESKRKEFGPQTALAYGLVAISQGSKNSRFPWPNPLPIALVMDMHASRTLCTGLYKS